MAEIKNLKKHLPERSKFYETGETLEDRTADGKPINWRADKLKNIEVADMLARLEKDKDGRVLNCGTLLEFKNRADGTKKLNRAYFCKNRLCPSCNKRKAWKRTGEISAVLDKAMQENPTGRFLFLTLTIENAFTAEQLAREIKEINSAFSRMTRYKKVSKNLLGYIRKTEITVNHKNYNAGKYNHHIHAIMFVKATYFSKDNYITQAEYTELWQKALKSETPNIVNVKIIKADADGKYKSAAMETGKYTVKDADYMTGHYLADLETVSDLSDALKGTRELSYGGILRKIKQGISKKSIILDETENETETAGDQIIRACWYWTKENYFIWREKAEDRADNEAEKVLKKTS